MVLKKSNETSLKKVLLACLFSYFLLQVSAQQKITMQGKIELLSHNKTLKLQTHFGNFDIPINTDESFKYELTIDEPGIAFLKTDSSTLVTLWLESGSYILNLKEYTQTNKWKKLAISSLQANQNAELRRYFDDSVFKIRGKSKEESYELHKKFTIFFLDSVISINPSSAILPEIIRLRQNYLGDSLSLVYLKKINTQNASQTNKDLIGKIENQIQRNRKIKNEEYLAQFNMKDNHGEKISLNQFKEKKIILINFWASWCAPCRSENKELKPIYEAYKDKGFEIIAVSLDNDKAAWLDAINKDEASWINISDLNGYESKIVQHYLIQTIPFNLVVDGSGKIIGTNLNLFEIKDLAKRL